MSEIEKFFWQLEPTATHFGIEAEEDYAVWYRKSAGGHWEGKLFNDPEDHFSFVKEVPEATLIPRPPL